MQHQHLPCPNCRGHLYPHGPNIITHWMCPNCGLLVKHEDLWAAYAHVSVGTLLEQLLRRA